MGKFDWAGMVGRLSAIKEEMGMDEREEGDEIDEGDDEDRPVITESLSMTQAGALAEMLGVSVEDLIEAAPEAIMEAMETLGYMLMNINYGEPGLQSKFPWEPNDGAAGHATQTASMDSESTPGTAGASIGARSPVVP